MKRRHKRTSVKSNGEIYRLTVYRSNTNIYAQIIDDEKGVTLASSSTIKEDKGSTVDAAYKVGQEVAKAASSKKIKKVIFDRNRYIYKGRVKALAEGAREGGLEF